MVVTSKSFAGEYFIPYWGKIQTFYQDNECTIYENETKVILLH